MTRTKLILLILAIYATSVAITIAITAYYGGFSQKREHEATRTTKSGVTCGVERWPVKTLSDPASSLVNLTPTRTRVVDLDKIPAPNLPSDNVTRLASEERTYLIKGTHLVEYKLEGDGDIHLVLKSPLNGDTMIAEIPNFACIANTTARARIADARAEFFLQVAIPSGISTTSFTHVDKVVALTGVLFFDFKHGQTGVAPNAVELHPVLSFRVL
jgi:hypothetical protein